MKISQRYTDEYYASVFEIRNDFSIGSETVVQEIFQYRKKYQIFFWFQNRKHSLYLTPKIVCLMELHLCFNQKDTLHPMIQLFMLRNDEKMFCKCLDFYSLSKEYLHSFNYIFSFEEDITKSFLEWLEHISTKSYLNVLHYTYKIGQLSKKQKDFLELYQDYFNIEIYKKEMSISYETARLQLVHLCNIGILTRHRIGKKYVYKGDL